MTKTLEEQIAEALAERDALVAALAPEEYWQECDKRRDTACRLIVRAASRLATLEAVRDGRMIPVYAAVSVTGDEGWIAHGLCGIDPTEGDVLDHLEHGTGDALTILRGYAYVPSTQVHEVEADSEVPS